MPLKIVKSENRPQDELGLVRRIEEAFTPWARRVRREVHARWPAGGSDYRPEGRIDLVISTPKEWLGWRRFPVIAIEAKDRPSWGDLQVGIRQTTSCMRTIELWDDDGPVPRPSIALLATRDSWETGEVLERPEPNHALGYASTLPMERHLTGFIERLLWREGCGILYGPRPWFRSNNKGLNHEEFHCQ